MTIVPKISNITITVPAPALKTRDTAKCEGNVHCQNVNIPQVNFGKLDLQVTERYGDYDAAGSEI